MVSEQTVGQGTLPGKDNSSQPHNQSETASSYLRKIYGFGRVNRGDTPRGIAETVLSPDALSEQDRTAMTILMTRDLTLAGKPTPIDLLHLAYGYQRYRDEINHKEKPPLDVAEWESLRNNISWAELREAWRTGRPYADIYSSLLPLTMGPAVLKHGPLPEVMATIDLQQQKAVAKTMAAEVFPQAKVEEKVDKSGKDYYRVNDFYGNRCSVWNEKENFKLWVTGYDIPKLGLSDTLTRLYVGLDPVKQTDAFFALTKELVKRGVLSDMELCLFNYDTDDAINMNKIVMYIDRSNDKKYLPVLDKVLWAYKMAKRNNPELFELTGPQKRGLLSTQLSTFRGLLDANLTFVEMPDNRSYDASGFDDIVDALGIRKDATHAERIAALKRSTEHGVVWQDDSREKIHTGDLKEGDVIKAIRRLSHPSLIQRQIYYVHYENGQRQYKPFNR